MGTVSALLSRTVRAKNIVRARRVEIEPLVDPPTIDPVVAARAVQLRYVSDTEPGIVRARAAGVDERVDLSLAAVSVMMYDRMPLASCDQPALRRSSSP